MIKKTIITVLGVAVCLSLLAARGGEEGKKKSSVDVSKLPPAADKQGVSYATDIKPIFEKSCTKCHGADKQKGHLRLDSLAAILKGGEDGKVIEPCKTAESLLVHNVSHLGHPDEYMPPPDHTDKIPPLTQDEIHLLPS